MKPYRVTHDLRRSDEGVNLLHHHENGHYPDDITPLRQPVSLTRISTLNGRNDTGGNEADNISNVGNDSKHSHHHSDKEDPGRKK